MSKYRLRPESPPGAPVRVEVYNVHRQGPVVVRWLAAPRGILHHFQKKNGLACPGEAACGLCRKGANATWVGFAPVQRWRASQWQDWCPAVLQVTEALQERLKAHVLRGTIWRIFEALGQSGKLENCGEELGEVAETELPESFSVEPAVCTIYRTTHIAWDVEPVLPPKLVMSASAGTAPPIPQQAASAEPDPNDPVEREKVRKILDSRKKLFQESTKP